ncbi:MAG: prolyl oligopeptidase family serine peptidase [Gemmatimonadetes bacterium]|nr:prolyl oligopeptidase family serine peptidase [Gemmatimonadota bacterium]
MVPGSTAKYRIPPDPIPAVVTAEPPPALSLSPDRSGFALLGRRALPGIADLAQPELRLAGVRIDPVTNGPSSPAHFHSVTLASVSGGAPRSVDLPPDPRLSELRWSPDGSWLAFVHTTSTGLELWGIETGTARTRRLSDRLNGTLGCSYQWEPSGVSLLVKRIPDGRGQAPEKPAVPSGPLIQENLGKTAPGRTYQDLLKAPHEERLFEHYFAAQLCRVGLDGGPAEPLGDPGIISDFSAAPGGEFLLVERLKRPFSYVVPYYRFPTDFSILDARGGVVRQLADLPLAEDVPVAFDAVPTGPRNVQWRADAPDTVVWVEALDGGDPRNAAEERDRVYSLTVPFTGTPEPLITLEHRCVGVFWGRDDFAMVFSRWWNTRSERRFAISPGTPSAPPRLLADRSYQNLYDDPGMPATIRNAAGRFVLLFTADGEEIFLSGDGASPRGDYPFLDRMSIHSGGTTRLGRAEDPYYEEVAAMLGPSGDVVLTRREAAAEPPNYYVRNLREGTVRALTDFPDPAPELAGITREIVAYARPDGVSLSATLLTPPGYDRERDGPLPMLVWAYPREFRDADAAGQVDDSPNRFSRPAGASHLFLLNQGYAILDGPAMPIIGVDEAEPNDSYVEQLVANAKAAVDRTVELGVADRERIGIGGHSYGAFMAANLLAHSDLFRAGIARSGAYNRTLTPFGFQQEQRTYWEAPDTYHRMSPFTYVDRIRAPVLLIHGEVDNNSGTFPLQSERFYHALKGHGATVRYVVLPHESHGYRARESVLHALAEMIDWMDRYVKNAQSDK